MAGAAALFGLCAGLSAPPVLSASRPRWQFIGPRALVPQCPVGNCQATASYQMGGRVNGLLWQGARCPRPRRLAASGAGTRGPRRGSKQDNQLSAFPLRLAQYADFPLWARLPVCGDGGAAAIDPADPARMWAACTRFVARAPFLVETTTGPWPGDSIAPPAGAGGLTEVTALHAEANGSLWAGASNGVLYRLSPDGAWKAMWRPSPPAWCARDGLDAVGAVTPGTSGSLWAIDGCGQVGLSTDVGASWRTLDPAAAPDLSRWPQGFADQGGLNAIWPDPASPGVAYLGYGTTGPHSIRQAVR